jgi:hypothetical protein
MGYSIRRACFRPRTRDFGVRNLTRFVRLEVRFKRLIALLSCVSPTGVLAPSFPPLRSL